MSRTPTQHPDPRLLSKPVVSSAGSTSSIMGLDDAPQEILERTALLDAETGERIGEAYGSVTPPITSERSIHRLGWYRARQSLLVSRSKITTSPIHIREKSQVLCTLTRMDSKLLVFTVCSCSLSVIPFFDVLWRRFGGDFLAGVTVASMLIPQSVSYASSLAKLSPVTGLVSKHTYLCLWPCLHTCPVFCVDPRHHLRAPRKLKTAERGSRGSAEFTTWASHFRYPP